VRLPSLSRLPRRRVEATNRASTTGLRAAAEAPVDQSTLLAGTTNGTLAGLIPAHVANGGNVYPSFRFPPVIGDGVSPRHGEAQG
jgi:hypothetical protein